jgi:nucleoside-diphosphate-sugar epimerase
LRAAGADVVLDAFHGRRALVTGAAGFIGAALCARLAGLGAQVHGVSRHAGRGGDSLRWWQADLADSAATDQVVANVQPDYVFHLAGAVTGSRDLDVVRDTLAGNLCSAVNLLVACQRAGRSKLVMAGSLEEPPPEDSQPVPASPYAASKWAASGYARMFHALYGARVAVARIFMVYGPGQRDVRKLVPYVCLAALRGEPPELMSGARPVDWIFVDDVVEGLLALALSPVDDGRHVDIGTGELVTTGEVATRICQLAGGLVAPRLGARADRPMEQVRRADPDAAESATGWRARVALDDGLARTLQWYRRYPPVAAEDAGEARQC